jgi:hypothetical protein
MENNIVKHPRNPEAITITIFFENLSDNIPVIGHITI